MRVVRPGSSQSMSQVLADASSAGPTYPEHGASLDDVLPAGYHHLTAGVVLGSGSEIFARAAEGLRTWQAHRSRGVSVFPVSAPLEVGVTVVVTLGGRVGAIAAPCRIIEVVEDTDRYGFAYGTLPGHPEQGEESFVVSTQSDGTVSFDIRAFSRPGDPLTRLAGPLGRCFQSLASKKYLRALRKFVTSPMPK